MVNNNGADVTMTKHMTLISCTIHIDLSDTIIYVETYMLDEAGVIAVRAPRAPPLPLDVLVVSLLEVVGSLFRLWKTRIFAGIPQALEVEEE